ncbi:4-alpha-glucanotransferase [Asinibacterium sp. OR53]|uniref:4-alpha-glucanotransferase n=1 Tax=Asinibacterium sp. OR53 TaxID=925409 RepID=UPI0004B06E25|nr:4-alpha-glucanotransferase [Asinibacterium sp. OR53]
MPSARQYHAPAVPATAVAKKAPGVFRKITFQLKFHTLFGQELFIVGNHLLLGNNDLAGALSMEYENGDYWRAVIELNEAQCTDQEITYNYVLKNADGLISFDWGADKKFNPARLCKAETIFYDAWNYAGYFENAFYTEPFKQVLLKHNHTAIKSDHVGKTTHVLMVKSPLLQAGQTLCILGNTVELGNWDTVAPVLMNRQEGEDSFTASLDLSHASFPIAYKYGVYDTEKNIFLRYEDGDNRILNDPGAKNRQVTVNDGFTILPDNTWKGAGVAIPVFGLRSEQSLGVGEFTDLKLLVNWARTTGLKLIQLLPVNDTTATHSWTDSYPYAAISAFALHPIYLNVEVLAGTKNKTIRQKISEERERLNHLPVVDYESVIKTKWSIIQDLYAEAKNDFFLHKDYQDYFEQNKHWLEPYAAFCYLRDLYGTVDFNQWPQYARYDATTIQTLIGSHQDEIGLHYYIQYNLHLQLKEATAYAHANGIIVKGDIAIGVYRHGVDAWQNPELYHMDAQAGAPPDDFAVKGQNWGFPTYNWERMREDGFAWWKQRFEQMSYYFDAFRIDHILGFFRIFSIPMHAIEGIMGHFVPAIPVRINEFHNRKINIDLHRFTQPYISDQVLWEIFGHDNDLVKKEFLQSAGDGSYALKPAFATQRQVETYFAALENDAHHQKVKTGLFDLISNVILFEAEQADGMHFHFRFGMENTSSYRHLDEQTKQALHELYIDYFFRRQDEFWKKEALLKLPALKRVTNMLVCGEDLGLVPACVPDVMHQLGLLSLEIQRMPKASHTKFFNPKDAPYLSVVTPSTHDMSTIRGWWEEDKTTIQQFYNEELEEPGTAPYYCEPWINKAIVLQHLHSPAMWSIFQLQDILGISEQLRRENPGEERINIPANPRHYWQYRMHLTLESLLAANAFNEEFYNYVIASGRLSD